MTATCKYCLLEKPLPEFPKHKRTVSGYSTSRCLSCLQVYKRDYDLHNKKRNAEYRANKCKSNPTIYKERWKKYYSSPENRVKHLVKNAEWRKVKVTLYKDAQKRWRGANKARTLWYGANYRAKRKQAFLQANKELTHLVLEEAYHLRILRKACTGIDWEVDHIVPLSGKFVSGLHVWNNFQVIPTKINRQKGNKYVHA